jgi:hypothetical protein
MNWFKDQKQTLHSSLALPSETVSLFSLATFRISIGQKKSRQNNQIMKNQMLQNFIDDQRVTVYSFIP